MPTLFAVKNFERFQHYRHRNPPWLKLYQSLLDDYEFAQLPDAARWHLVAIWLLASRYQNAIKWDAAYIGRRINATTPVDLELLARRGFLIPDQPLTEPASNLLADCKQPAIAETEGESEKEKEKERKKSRHDKRGTRLPDDWALTADLHNTAVAARARHGLPSVNLALEAEKFRNHWLGSNAPGSRKLDWRRAWINWALMAKGPPGPPDYDADAIFGGGQ